MSDSTTWTPDSWRQPQFARDQQPTWPDTAAHADVLKRLRAMPPLIYAGEARNLMAELASAAQGEAFVLQAGDCAETFDAFSADRVRDGLKIILQMAVVLTYSAQVPVVKIGRVAGQFAKPRSADTETWDGVELPSYRGDMVNRTHFSAGARTPDSENIIRAYEQSASTLNLLRGFVSGGFADLRSVHSWNREFVANSDEGRQFESIAEGIDSAMRFMRACRIDSPSLHQVSFYTSHESLVLDYEEALTRQDSTAGDAWYDCSAHMLWVGARTKGPDSAHVEFLSGVGNPVGVKIDRTVEPDFLLDLCERLNPERRPGRLTLVSRMGRAHVSERLPRLIEAVAAAGHPVLWMCDPMHGNTVTSDGGLKTRRFEDVFEEISAYFAVHRNLGTWPGGLHLELTGDNVTECIGGWGDVADEDLHLQYQTACDPRLNARQSLHLAYKVAGELLEGFPRAATD